jgi:integrase/recombinase XerD
VSNTILLGPWIRRFLLEHLVSERNLSRNTQRSYRDTFALLVPFVGAKLHKPIDRLSVTDLSADKVRSFLADLEQTRGCGIPTRNQRLAAIHALARFVALHSPEHTVGPESFAPYRLKRLASSQFRTLKNQKWMAS